MAKFAKDLSAGTLHPRENIFGAGVIGAVDGEVIIAADGCASVALDLRGTFSMTLQVAGSVDGTNWTLIPVRAMNVAGVGYVAAVVGAVPGIWIGKCAPFRFVRVRCTAFTSGSAVVTLAGDIAPIDDSLQGMVTPALVTATGAAGAAVTLSLPAPGAGLRQYVTYIAVVRSASTALTAGAAPTVITTTGLPGALALTMGANAAAIGEDKVIREDFAYPLAATAQNAAATIVCPATPGAIWRATAGYYIAP